jgi:hypothetical protein
VLLNSDLGAVRDLALACRDGRHPVGGSDSLGGRPFREALLTAVPQLALAAWELNLNGYSALHPREPLSRALLDARQRQPVLGGRSAIDAAFSHAHNAVAVLEHSFGLAEGLAALRQRHAQRHAAYPWCWLRYLYPLQQAWDLVHMLEDELRRWEGHPVDTPGRLRCEGWYAGARQYWATVQGTRAGFDWGVPFGPHVDLPSLVYYLATSLDRYDESLVAGELLNEAEYMGAWAGQQERAAPPPAQAAHPPQPEPPAVAPKRRRRRARDAKAEARDRWLYQQCKKGKQYKTIMLELGRVASDKGWEDLSSPQGVQQAVERYIARHGLDPLPPRKDA